MTASGPIVPDLSLSVAVGDHEYFDNEPIYAVFQLTNSGSDTAWIMPYGLAGLNLRAELIRSDGVVFRDWGIIADYITSPGWKGAPIPPQRSLYEMGLLQDRWGQYDTIVRNLYNSHHVAPGQYQLQATFAWDPTHTRPPIRAPATPFTVRSRSPAEDSVLARLSQLVGMAWDTTKRPRYLDSLVAYVEQRVAADPTDPFLAYLAVQKVATAAAVGYAPDSATIDRLVTVCTATALANPDSPAGAYSVLGVSYYRPEKLHTLAAQLGNTLAGRVATQLVKQGGH